MNKQEHLTIKPMDLANYIVERQVKKGNPTNTLTLQKVLYFVGCEYMRHQNSSHSLFDDSDTLMKWKFGPTFPEVYEVYSFYGSLPVSSIPFTQIFDWDVEEFQEKIELSGVIDLELLHDWIDKYVNLQKYDLVTMTLSHRNWKKDKEEIESGNYVAYQWYELYQELTSNKTFFDVMNYDELNKNRQILAKKASEKNMEQLYRQLKKIDGEVHQLKEKTETDEEQLKKKQKEAEKIIKKINASGVSDKEIVLFLLGFSTK